MIKSDESQHTTPGTKPKQRGTKYQQRFSEDAFNTEVGDSTPRSAATPDSAVPTGGTYTSSKPPSTKRPGR